MQPTLFLSYGSPMIALMDSPARDFLAGLGASLPERPQAILAISAHWEAATPMLSAVARNETTRDFYGFPKSLFEMQYNAPGAPELAARIAAMLHEAGFSAELDTTRVLDHGPWVPLILAYARADIPVLQLSVQNQAGATVSLRARPGARPIASTRRAYPEQWQLHP